MSVMNEHLPGFYDGNKWIDFSELLKVDSKPTVVDNTSNEYLKEFCNINMFLFGRWVVTCYSTDHLNSINGNEWLTIINHFNNVILPNYMENGTFKNAVEFIKLQK